MKKLEKELLGEIGNFLKDMETNLFSFHLQRLHFSFVFLVLESK